jgi:hypothetical protein
VSTLGWQHSNLACMTGQVDVSGKAPGPAGNRLHTIKAVLVATLG